MLAMWFENSFTTTFPRQDEGASDHKHQIRVLTGGGKWWVHPSGSKAQFQPVK